MDIEADKGEALVFASALMQQVNTEDVANMVQVQRGMLQRFEKTNEMLLNFNVLSTLRYNASVKDFQKHTQLLFDMKKDLDSIFKRIRILKQRLSKSYPEAFAACSTIIRMEEGEEEEDVTSTSTTTTATTTTPTTQPGPCAQSILQPTDATASSAAKKTVEKSGEASKATIAQSQKPRSKSSTGRKVESGGGVGQSVRKTGRSATENRGSGGGSQPQAKLI